MNRFSLTAVFVLALAPPAEAQQMSGSMLPTQAASPIAAETFSGTGAPAAASLANRATDSGVTFNLKEDFGAACDGATDDTTQIQNWLAKAASGVRLVFPAGTCLFSSTLAAPTASNYSISGAGSAASVLKYTGASTATPLINLGSATETGVVPVDFSVTSVNAVTGPLLAINGAAYTPVGTGDRRIVNALDLGADPTGVADSTNAIQAAFNTGTNSSDKSAALPGVCVYLPAGTYLVTGTITLPHYNACLIGDGRTLSVLTVPYSSTWATALPTGVLVAPYGVGNDWTGPILRDFGIAFTGQVDGPTRANLLTFPPGIFMQQVSRARVERVRITGGTSCIDARGNVGGSYFVDDECGAIAQGLQLGGAATFGTGQTGTWAITRGTYDSGTSTVTLTGTSWGTPSPAVAVTVQNASPSCLNGTWLTSAVGANTLSYVDTGCSAWTGGGTISTSGAGEGVHVYGWHAWDFGWSTTSHLKYIYCDGTNVSMQIGRVDQLDVIGGQSFCGNVVYNLDASNSEDRNYWTDFGMDSSAWQQSGGTVFMSGGNLLTGGLGPYQNGTNTQGSSGWSPRIQMGAAGSDPNAHLYIKNATIGSYASTIGAINVTSGYVDIDGGQLNCSNGAVPCGLVSGGGLSVRNVDFSPNAAPASYTIVTGSINSSTITLTGSWGTVAWGPLVTISGATPSCLNGTWVITNSAANSVSFTNPVGCSVWTAGGTVGNTNWSSPSTAYLAQTGGWVLAVGNRFLNANAGVGIGYASDNAFNWTSPMANSMDGAQVVPPSTTNLGFYGYQFNPAAYGKDSSVSMNATGGASTGFTLMNAGVQKWRVLLTSGNNDFQISDKTSGSPVSWLTVLPGGSATIGESPSNTTTINGGLAVGGTLGVAGNTSLTGGSLSVSSATGNAIISMNAPSGYGAGIVLQANGSNAWETQAIGSGGTAGHFQVDDIANGYAAALDVAPGGSVTVGEQNSNVLTVTGSLAAKASATPTASGSCAVASLTGGQIAGSFKASAPCAGGTVTLAFAATQANGYACDAHDETTPLDILNQTAHTTTAVTLAGSMANGDIVVWKCVGF
ncbi:pectate lyase-like protein [Roseiarcus fermentans]|uniref:Pectate lyase-like protein n=1 Tax=Roseiarcus fermentans TaxID=1473586 RepID=A0A366FX90_9HYPH|nr:glycosyl hydrolase family 28-related protein [Roseiarcus fermentans]RBP18319.1 pectate lyase-like protein [Roseiarcus fermentans]